MNDETKSVLGIIFVILSCPGAGYVFETWSDWGFATVPVVLLFIGIAADIVYYCGTIDFKIKYAIVLSFLIIFFGAASITAYFLFTPAMLTFELLAVSLFWPHFYAIDTLHQGIFESLLAGVISHTLLLYCIPFTAFCFTLSWSAIVLPGGLLIYTFYLAGVSLEPAIRDNQNFNPRTASKILSVIAAACVIATGLFFFFDASLVSTTTTALTAVVLSYSIVDMELFVALRNDAPQEPVFILGNAAAALGAAAVAGAARSAAVQPLIWEATGAIVIICIVMPQLVDMLGTYRETDSHLAQPDPITARVVLKLIVLAIMLLGMIACVAGALLFRLFLPSISSPVPIIACIIIFLTLFILDNIRNHVARQTYNVFVFITLLITFSIILCGVYMYIKSYTAPFMEAAITGIFFSFNLMFYFWRTRLQKDESEKRQLAAQQVLLNQQIQQIQQHFWGTTPPGA